MFVTLIFYVLTSKIHPKLKKNNSSLKVDKYKYVSFFHNVSQKKVYLVKIHFFLIFVSGVQKLHLLNAELMALQI